MSALTLPPGLDPDCDVIVVMPVDAHDPLQVVEYDPAADDWALVMEAAVGGWPEIAESADGSPLDQGDCCLWVNSSALTPGLNERASVICGFDVYGTAVLAASRREALAGIALQEAAELLSALAGAVWQAE